MKLNSKIKKYCISINTKILEVYKKFDKNKKNFLIIINKDQQFLGIITPADIRKGFIKGYSLRSSIKDIFNKSPISITGKNNIHKINSIFSFLQVFSNFMPEIY